ncbi:MAG: efflux RND transporter periplasmic adaptor subunit [Planctomycetaceae bacterium]|nr:efflux RND transporter periplasmic adaptor subunit [Planctomycetaceae bacterium]
MPNDRNFRFLLALIACATLPLSGCTKTEAPSGAEKKPAPVSVKTVSLNQEQIKRTSVQPATVLPYHRTEIRANLSGYVSEVLVDIGDVVEAQKPLAKIAVPELDKQRLVLQARVEYAKAQELQASAGVTLATAQAQSAEAVIEQAKSELSKTAALLAAAEAEFTRINDLVSRQSLENRVLDEVRKKRDAELASQQAVQSSIKSAEAEYTVAQAKIAAAEAELAAAKAETSIAERELEELDELIAYATLKAPFAGVVTQRHLDPGDLVRKTSEVGTGAPLFVISKVDKVRVHIPVPEVDAPYIQPGDVVTLEFPSFQAEAPIKASVTRIAGELDKSTRTMLVEVELDNTQGKLIPGMFGKATIEMSQQSVARTLPARAIRFISGEAIVYVVDESQTVSVTKIKTGFDNGHSIEVSAGLEPGQEVIDAHLQRFVDGQKVTVLNR